MAYTATQGEAWDVIAKNKFKSEFYMHDIVEVNPMETDAVFLSGDMAIELPAKTEMEAVKTLPPWEKL